MSPGASPPRFWEWLLGRVLHPADREAALGDLAEEHAMRCRAGQEAAARRWYRRQVVRSLAPALRRRVGGHGVQREPEEGRMGTLLRDARFALRGLARSPAFATTALGTLALGVGAATAVFTVVEGVLLSPLPWPDPDRLRMVYQERDGSSFWVSSPNFLDWAETLDGFEGLAAYNPDGLNMLVGETAVRVASAEVSEGFFRTLGVEPVVGRTFTGEEAAAAAPVAVVSHRMWMDHLGGEPVDGATVMLDGAAHRVVGVLPPGRMVPADADVWVPLRLDSPDWRTRRGIGWLLVIGRVAPGVTDDVLEAELDAVGAALREAHPDANDRMGIQALSLQETIVGDVRTPLRVLMAAVVLILLVASTNVASLILARGMARRREVAIRSALGGGRGRLARQFLAEGLVLGGIGALLGLAAARVGVEALLALAPADVPRLDEVRVGPASWAFAGAVSLASAMAFGLLPTIQAARGRLLDGLREGGGGGPGAGMRRALVTGQLALAVALGAASTLLLTSLQELRRVDPGFDPEGVLAAGVPVVESDFASPAERVAYFQSLVERAGAIPGVQRAAAANAVPFVNGGPTFSYELRRPPDDPDARLLARYRVVTPGIFEALGMRMARGRGFSQEEATPGGPRAMVIDEAMAEAHFPDGALGEEIGILDEWWTVVGVVETVRDGSLRGTPDRHLYLPLARATRQGMALVLRTGGDPSTLVEPLRRAVREVGPRQPLTNVAPLTERVAASVAQPRLLAWLVASFALAAGLLASLGVYGVMAQVVAGRTREIGVRVALGADRGQVRRLVVRRAAGMVAGGLALGLAFAIAGTPRLEALLFGVDARDPAVLGGVALALAAVALVAAWIPARRAAALDPAEALRSD